MTTDEPCVCDTAFTCVAGEHDKGRCDACEAPGIYSLRCVPHLAHMCPACVDRCHPLAECGSAPMFPSVGEPVGNMACVLPESHVGPHRDRKGRRRL